MSGALQHQTDVGAFTPVVHTYTTGSGATETAPNGAGHVQITCMGPGGNGGAGNTANPGGGGGGGGAYCQSSIVAITGGVTWTYTVGTVGSSATTVVNGTAPVINLSAGTGANGTSSAGGGAQGNGGTASGGATNTAGSNGGAGSSGNGGAGGAGAPPIGGAGAGSPGPGTGTAGTAPGGGGSGTGNASAAAGGAGALGQVSFAYTA